MSQKVSIAHVGAGSGLGSSGVGSHCGLHVNFASNHTLLDFSGAAATEYVFTASRPCTIQRAVLTINEVVAAAATVNVGKINGATTTANHFVNAYATDAAVAAGTEIELTLANTAVATGDTVTVNSAGGSGGTGTGWITIEYTINDTKWDD